MMHRTVEGQVGPLAVCWQAHPSQDQLVWPAPFKMECEMTGAVLQTRKSGVYSNCVHLLLVLTWVSLAGLPCPSE